MAELDFKQTARRLLAEYLGTILFLYPSFTSIIDASTSSGKASGTSTTVFISMTFGLSLAIAILIFGSVSGGHFNPAVSLAFLVQKKLPFKAFLLYCAAQILGAITAAAWIFGSHGGAEAVCNKFGAGVTTGGGFMYEFLITLVLVFVIMALFGNYPVISEYCAPWLIGLVLFLGHANGIPVTGNSLNPARSFGPALVSGHGCWENHWVYWVAPLLAGAVAGWSANFIFAPSTESENKVQPIDPSRPSIASVFSPNTRKTPGPCFTGDCNKQTSLANLRV